jgi:thiol-disulfide isomerase/thioredoxin
VVGPFTLGHIAALLGTLVGVAVLLIAVTTPVGAPLTTEAPRPGASFYIIGERTEGLAIGQVAPELAGEREGQPVTLTDLDGEPVSLAALRGHPVWVNFWASWCPPCQQETPVLRDLYDSHAAEGLRLIGVSVQEASPDEVRRYVQTYDVPYPIAFDGTSAVFHAWRGFGLPTHYLIDADGIVRAVHYGPLSRDGAERLLATILPPASPDASPSPSP